jgi:hypothetical protein
MNRRREERGERGEREEGEERGGRGEGVVRRTSFLSSEIVPQPLHRPHVALSDVPCDPVRTFPTFPTFPTSRTFLTFPTLSLLSITVPNMVPQQMNHRRLFSGQVALSRLRGGAVL